jgi:DNA-binding IscR family transcriptional regulator
LIARDLAEVTVADVYEALGAPGLFSIGPRVDSPGCPIEKAVDRAIERALGEAEALVLAELRSLSVADLAKTRRRKS